MLRIIAIAAFAGGIATAASAAPSCAALETGAEAALGASGTSAAATISYPGLADTPGCQVSFSGTGAVYGTDFQAVAAKLDTMMTGAGWAQDQNAAADGPDGTAMGYRKTGQAVVVNVSYDTAKGVCREDAPIASCHPTAAQMQYTITLGLIPTS